MPSSRPNTASLLGSSSEEDQGPAPQAAVTTARQPKYTPTGVPLNVFLLVETSGFGRICQPISNLPPYSSFYKYV